jgi:hypothetical protein
MTNKDRFTKRENPKKKRSSGRSAVERPRPHQIEPIDHDEDELDVEPLPTTLPTGGRATPRQQRLSDLLSTGARRDLASAWHKAEPAGEFAPLPPGVYVALIVEGAIHSSKQRRTPGYKLTFEVAEGEFTGRKFWHDIWLTPPAVPMAKRDLGKLGVPVDDFDEMRAHLEQPLPDGIHCRVRLSVRTDDDGRQSNRVQWFTVVAIEGPDRDAFAPDNAEEDSGYEPEEEDFEEEAEYEGREEE